ncbi:hypothetical protein PAXRUDRAFT_833843 [Paxillus rubicundulus Ve08.2h10]|uniref:Unplaced genomic scaffold scaffold_1321, whole genome shotgun sequence n=1 Tax=Paxillus rubicundulus Ve08.2h10 TaxID=930991 RepID=A0A0D0CWQ1_9AGAM|nr:hypothetical protein PAXRUDRAFT_833843 [Paxillus rubicundulus Ve08.2h10]
MNSESRFRVVSKEETSASKQMHSRMCYPTIHPTILGIQFFPGTPLCSYEKKKVTEI